MKKLINRPEDVVPEMIEGLLALHPALARVPGHNVVTRRDAEAVRDRQAAIISGGGSGHEPAHAGFVGEGMLSAAVAGEVFTSPPASSVFAAIRAVTGKAGALLIIKNYTGDRLNFGLAAEMARSEGIAVEQIVVADDFALAQSGETAGRRGLAGTVLIHKIAGAAAAQGMALRDVKAIAQQVADNLATMSVSLSAGTSPASGRPSFTLPDNEVELGLGIHGEPGVQRSTLLPADQMVEELVRPLLTSAHIGRGERIAAVINNLGTTTTMEQAIVARHLLSHLRAEGLHVERLYAGTFMSSLDMAGISITLLRVDDRLLSYLDLPTDAPGWPNVPRQPPRVAEVANKTPVEPQLQHSTGATPSTRLSRAILACCRALLSAENRLTELDRITGDGDLGINMARTAKALQDHLPEYTASTPEALKSLGQIAQTALGGSSGPLYSAFFLRCATSLRERNQNEARSWSAAGLQGCSAIAELGDARLGDRTMLDSLLPFCQTLGSCLDAGAPEEEALLQAAAAAEAGAQSTAQLIARRGRASYLGERVLGHPDPGAVAAAIWLRAAVDSLLTP